MRARQAIALGLALLLAAGSATACTSLRTPYERQKMAESGGKTKQQDEGGGDKKKGGQGGGEGGKGSDAGSSSAPQEDKGAQGGGKAKAAEAKKKPATPGRAETVGEKEERMKGQGLLYIGSKQMDKQKQAKSAQKDDQSAQAKGKQQAGQDLVYNKKMSAEVAKVEGVDSATVLLDAQHNAYVALTAAESQPAKGSKGGSGSGSGGSSGGSGGSSGGGGGGDNSGGSQQSAVKTNAKLKVKTEGNVSDTVQEKIAEELRGMDPNVGTVNITANPTHVKSFQRYTTGLENGEKGLKTQALAEHIQDIWHQ